VRKGKRKRERKDEKEEGEEEGGKAIGIKRRGDEREE
jgi:hypothetical protein